MLPLLKVLRNVFTGAGFDLGDGWRAHWSGPSDVILIYNRRRYSVHVPETRRRGWKRVRSLNRDYMERHWWKPHDDERLNDAELVEILSRARKAVEMFGQELTVLGELRNRD